MQKKIILYIVLIFIVNIIFLYFMYLKISETNYQNWMNSAIKFIIESSNNQMCKSIDIFDDKWNWASLINLKCLKK